MIPASAIISEATLTLPAELDYLPQFLDHVRRLAEGAGMAATQIIRLELAVEEAIVNVCHHAYAGWTVPGVVRCRVAANPEGLQVEIGDESSPFDPLSRSDPDTGIELGEREPGGLGILLIKNLVSEVTYRREAGWNVLTLGMRKVVRDEPDAGS